MRLKFLWKLWFHKILTIVMSQTFFEHLKFEILPLPYFSLWFNIIEYFHQFSLSQKHIVYISFYIIFYFIFKCLVTEFEADEFKVFLEYLHTGSCIIYPEILPSLLCIASHYEVDALADSCFRSLDDLITPNNVSLKPFVFCPSFTVFSVKKLAKVTLHLLFMLIVRNWIALNW